MSDAQKALEYVRGNKDRYLNELKEFLAIPSISTLSENKGDVQRAAEWVAAVPPFNGFIAFNER